MSAEGIEGIRALKKTVFFELMRLAGRVFIAVRHSPDAVIGSRGFLPEEQQSGLVLVLNSRMQFSWIGTGIDATLVFGTTPQKCFIPTDDIAAIYSPELGARFLVDLPSHQAEKAAPEPGESTPEEKIVRVDFRKKRR